MFDRIRKAAEPVLVFLSVLPLAGIWLVTDALAQSSDSKTGQPIKFGSGANAAASSSTNTVGNSSRGGADTGSFSGTTYAPPQRFSSKYDNVAKPDSPYSSQSTTSAAAASPVRTGDKSGEKRAGSLSSGVKPELSNSGMLNNSAGGQFSNGYTGGYGFQNGYSAGTQFRNSAPSPSQQSSAPLNYVRMPDGTYRANGSNVVRDERIRVQ